MKGEEIPADDLAGIANWMLQQRTPGSASSDDQLFTPPVEDLAAAFPDFAEFSLIGSGGMGSVYRAYQTKLAREIAIKTLTPAKKHDSGFRERFAREALSMAQMDHPNIVAIHETGVREDLFYIIMEFVPGRTLRDEINKGPLSTERARDVMQQLCAGMEHAHDRGVLHRDLKPRNILLHENGTVKIADFGLAKILDETKSDFTLTLTEIALGTPAYMAPEQSQSLPGLDQRADIYSLGVVFYEMLTGKLPTGKFAPPTKDEHLNNIVHKALDSLPENRFQEVSDLSAALTSRPPRKLSKWLALVPFIILIGFFIFKYETNPTLELNSLGMEFSSIPGTSLLIAKWETRVSDFREFTKETGYQPRADMLTFNTDKPLLPFEPLGGTWQNPGFPQNDDHPVVGVSLHDAMAFCDWLTKKEQDAGNLTDTQFYRLPTDQEWSLASGLNENPPAQDPINHALTDYLPWDEKNAPPPGSGNFADSSTRKLFPRLPVLTDYHDNFPATSPVDEVLLGNVWEWTTDATLRGGSWTTGSFNHYLPGLRITWHAELQRNDIGFRCILVTEQ